jgi:hypothetical protein
MELDSEEVVSFDDGGKCVAIFASRDRGLD